MNQDNGQIGAQPVGGEEGARMRDRVRGRVKVAGESASEAAREGRERAAEWARTRGNDYMEIGRASCRERV